MDSFYIPPGSVAAPTSGQSSIGVAAPGATPQYMWSSNGSSPRPLVNIAKDWVPPVVVPKPVAPVASVSPVNAAHKSRIVGLVAMGAVALLALGGGAYALLSHKPAPKQPAVALGTPRPTATPSATPTPSPTPSSTPVPQTVSQPAVAPTLSHPQSVTVKATNGLWLRSSATSVDRSNIIGWMPNGAVVSVDTTGEFWWHGTYQGKTGYFASTYTN